MILSLIISICLPFTVGEELRGRRTGKIEETKGIFGSKEPVRIWVSVDPQHIPVAIERRLKVGKISFQMEEMNVKGERSL